MTSSPTPVDQTSPSADTAGELYIFFRADMWYPIELRDDADAVANALCNPGTTRVEDVSGRVVWQMQ